MNFILLLAFALVSSVKCDGHWDYLRQNEWPESFADCGGRSQSPIDIQDVCLPGSRTHVNGSMKINLINYNKPQRAGFNFTNNGHTAQLSLNGGQELLKEAPKLTGSAADNQLYQFSQLHFHWDQNDTQGSEHSFHGVRRALEMHLVHWNVKYGNFNEASNKPDGLLVFAVLFHAGLRENPLLNPIVDNLADIVRFGSQVAVDPFTLGDLLPASYQTFYRYRGSLTTPPCYESVNWLLSAELENIGYSQLLEFAKLDNQENRALGNTNRDLQAINSRLVEASSNRHCFHSTNRQAVSRPSRRGTLLMPELPPELHHSDPSIRERIEKWLSKWM